MAASADEWNGNIVKPAVTTLSATEAVDGKSKQACIDAERGGEGEPPRSPSTVRETLLTVIVVMVQVSIVAVVSGLICYYMGWMFALQLCLVALVAYLAAGGGYRWFYVALRTLPRDTKALFRYAGLLLQVKSYERKNMTISDIFSIKAAKHPNKACFVFEDSEMTFAQVEEYANRVANVFQGLGYRKGDVVALFLDNRPEFVCLWLGLSKIGVIVPLINHNLRNNPLVHSLTVANCQAVIFGSDLASAIQDVRPSLPSTLSLFLWSPSHSGNVEMGEKDLSGLLRAAPATQPQSLDPLSYSDRLVYIYTSGTTGLPKAAVITNSRFIFMAAGMSWIGGFQVSDRFYTPLPLYHTAGGVMSIGQALIFGSTVVIRHKFSATAYFADCKKYRCTVAQYIGEMARYILATPPKPAQDEDHKIRLIFGNGLRPQIWTQFIQRFNIPNVAEFYGATEGNANIVNMDNTVGAIGFLSRIIPAVYPISIIRVDPHSGEPVRDSRGLCAVCRPGEPGVFIGKINPSNPTRAFLGYVDKAASEKKIVRDVFAKGDTAFISGDILVADELGYLYFKDRTGDTFRWKGENVSTSEVEAVISNLVGYRDAIVYGVEVHNMEGRAGMVAIMDEDHTLDLSVLADGVKKALPAYARPLFVRRLRKVDITGTFKLKKTVLQEEGFNPAVLTDDLYYLVPSGAYEPLTVEACQGIVSGTIRL